MNELPDAALEALLQAADGLIFEWTSDATGHATQAADRWVAPLVRAWAWNLSPALAVL